jgi:hypothetical protein
VQNTLKAESREPPVVLFASGDPTSRREPYSPESKMKSFPEFQEQKTIIFICCFVKGKQDFFDLGQR